MMTFEAAMACVKGCSQLIGIKYRRVLPCSANTPNAASTVCATGWTCVVAAADVLATICVHKRQVKCDRGAVRGVPAVFLCGTVHAFTVAFCVFNESRMMWAMWVLPVPAPQPITNKPECGRNTCSNTSEWQRVVSCICRLCGGRLDVCEMLSCSRVLIGH